MVSSPGGPGGPFDPPFHPRLRPWELCFHYAVEFLALLNAQAQVGGFFEGVRFGVGAVTKI